MSTIIFTVNVIEDDIEDPQDLLDQIVGKRAVVDTEGYRFYGVVQAAESVLADLARAYEEQRRPGSNHLMTEPLAQAIEALLARTSSGV